MRIVGMIGDVRDEIMHMNTSNQREFEGSMPTEEKNQPDPMLQISIGAAGAGGIALVALASAVILGIVLYGLNAGGGAEQAASTPPAAHNTQPGTAPHTESGGKG